MPRITPLHPPYEPAIDAQLASMMPPDVPPLLLFRTFARNPTMTSAMSGWGRYELGPGLSLSLRDREILIDRTCARCGCEYEWGVHVAFFAERAGLGIEQIASITHGTPDDPCWIDERDRSLIRLADALHDDATIGDDLFGALRGTFAEEELLDAFMLCGWYHAVCFTANACGVEPEPLAPRFDLASRWTAPAPVDAA